MAVVVGSYLAPIWRTDSYKCYTCVIILTIQRNGRLILEKSYLNTSLDERTAILRHLCHCAKWHKYSKYRKMAEKRGAGMFVYEEKLYFCN